MELKSLDRDHADLRLTRDEVVYLNNALNEVLHGIDDPEIGTRVGAPSEELSDLRVQLGAVVDKMKSLRKTRE